MDPVAGSTKPVSYSFLDFQGLSLVQTGLRKLSSQGIGQLAGLSHDKVFSLVPLRVMAGLATLLEAVEASG